MTPWCTYGAVHVSRLGGLESLQEEEVEGGGGGEEGEEEDMKTEPLAEKQLNLVPLAVEVFGMKVVGFHVTLHG